MCTTRPWSRTPTVLWTMASTVLWPRTTTSRLWTTWARPCRSCRGWTSASRSRSWSYWTPWWRWRPWNHKGFTMTAWLFHLILLWIELTTTRSCIRHDTARFESNKINQVVLSLLFSRDRKIFNILCDVRFSTDFRPECFCFCLCSVSRVYQNLIITSTGILIQIVILRFTENFKWFKELIQNSHLSVSSKFVQRRIISIST